ncbi:surface antigen-like protein [Leptomonas pyrrhocoris]|uniref:Surface antigen-like protein n=1 Tax=Leptomonas pyrrhocoris TaxID=157538 RepID=A0A0N0DR61_LEPPY|nr:surface antigen-like protein [Leptomonas pyrrhocoris]KPA74188.1 surface antigen-like protein [Leptomonas pyrrhocoris]|eukprot:XP_015652627.1 surface antigen-like protein [Leptomonas pyrrhocoris]
MCASAHRHHYYYTATQQANTRAFLQSFVETMPPLARYWTGYDFCRWVGVTCTNSGVAISSANMAMLRGTTVSLPAVSPDVDGSQVMLTTLSFRGPAKLSGSLPRGWGSLSRLQGISVGGNSLTGTLPTEYGDLAHLTTLDLFDNRFTGTIPASWGDLSACTAIALHNNNLTGTLPAEWGKLQSITAISVQQNKLIGTLPEAWESMTMLSSLHISNNGFTGPIPASWGNMPSISFFMNANNHICGCVPQPWRTKGVWVGGDDAVVADNCATANACEAATTTTTTTSEPTTTTTTTTIPVPTKSNITSTTTTTTSPVCHVSSCMVCNASSANNCIQCLQGFLLTPTFLCRARGVDTASSPLHGVAALVVAAAVTLLAA